MTRLRLWCRTCRAPFFTASVVPVVLGTALAWRVEGKVNLLLFALALLAMLLIHAGANMANDYFDHLSGVDERNPQPLTPFAGGSRVIQEGLVEPRQVLRAAEVCLALGALLGLYLAWRSTPLLLLLGGAGLAIGYFYTAPPLRLSHKGLGELGVALCFGVLPVLGAYLVQTSRAGISALLLSLPLALLIACVLWVNEFPDREWDEAAGKRTLVVRLGGEGASRLFVVLMGLSYALVPLLAFCLRMPWLLLGLVPLPLAWEACRRVLRHHSHPRKLLPACALTISSHFLTGALLAVGLVVG